MIFYCTIEQVFAIRTGVNQCRHKVFSKKSRIVKIIPPNLDALRLHIERAQLRSRWVIWFSTIKRIPRFSILSCLFTKIQWKNWLINIMLYLKLVLVKFARKLLLIIRGFVGHYWACFLYKFDSCFPAYGIMRTKMLWGA